jgi:hypothetical protein
MYAAAYEGEHTEAPARSAAASIILLTLDRVIGPPRSDANTKAPVWLRLSSRSARSSSPWIG